MKIKKEKTLVNKFIIKNIIILCVIFFLGSILVFVFGQRIHNNQQKQKLLNAYEQIINSDMEKQMKDYINDNVAKYQTLFYMWQEKGIRFIIYNSDGRLIFKTDNVKRKGAGYQVDVQSYSQVPFIENTKAMGASVIQMKYKVIDKKDYYITERINSELVETNIPYLNRIFIGLLLIYSIASIVIVSSNLIKIKKSILEIKKVTEKISKKDFSSPKVETDCKEINELSDDIEYMKNEIEMYLSVADRYNKLLKEDFDRQVSIDETRKKFINNISHEMRTPLTIIVNCKELLNQIKDENKRKKYEETIDNELTKLDELVDGMINVYSEEDSFTERKKENVNITRLIKDAIDRYFVLSKRKNVELIYDGTEHWITVNLFDFNLVVNNLLMNAYKYVEKNGTIIIYVQDNEMSIKVSIYNDAQPIKEDQIDKIWDKFYRGTGVYGKGTGLGLYLVKNTLNLMNGECGVKNVGDGVEFWFEIPK